MANITKEVEKEEEVMRKREERKGEEKKEKRGKKGEERIEKERKEEKRKEEERKERKETEKSVPETFSEGHPALRLISWKPILLAIADAVRMSVGQDPPS